MDACSRISPFLGKRVPSYLKGKKKGSNYYGGSPRPWIQEARSAVLQTTLQWEQGARGSFISLNLQCFMGDKEHFVK